MKLMDIKLATESQRHRGHEPRRVHDEQKTKST